MNPQHRRQNGKQAPRKGGTSMRDMFNTINGLIGSGDPIKVQKANRMLEEFGMKNRDVRHTYIAAAYVMSCNICFGTDHLLENKEGPTGGSFWSMLQEPILKVGIEYVGKRRWNWIRQTTYISLVNIKDFAFKATPRAYDEILTGMYGEYDLTWTWAGTIRVVDSLLRSQQDVKGTLTLVDAINNTDPKQGEAFWSKIGMNSRRVTELFLLAHKKKYPDDFFPY